MITPLNLSDIELEVLNWLESTGQNRLKDFFLADLSWADTDQQRINAFVDFFISRMGAKVFNSAPETVKNYVLQHSSRV